MRAAENAARQIIRQRSAQTPDPTDGIVEEMLLDATVLYERIAATRPGWGGLKDRVREMREGLRRVILDPLDKARREYGRF